MTPHNCKKCKSENTHRKTRRTLVDRFFMSLLGYYPWECEMCWHRFYAKSRGRRLRS